MRNRFLKLGMLVLVLAFGIAVAGCGGSSSPASGGLDPRLFGEWVYQEDPAVTIYFHSNGTFSFFWYDDLDFVGQWSTSGNRITIISPDGTDNKIFSISGGILDLGGDIFARP